MSAALKQRLARLEGHAPPEHRQALLVLHGDGHDPCEIIGVYGINVPRMANESAADFMARLEAHIRATRGRALPFVGFAQYKDDGD